MSKKFFSFKLKRDKDVKTHISTFENLALKKQVKAKMKFYA